MSEASEKVQGVNQLALFPLPLVLLPNEFLPLHIFEPRYRQMLHDVKLDRNLFGITFFDPQENFLDKPEIGTVGCVAEIREEHTMPDESSNILTSGVIRYRLLSYLDTATTPYFTAQVEFFEDNKDDSIDLKSIANEVFALFERVAKAAFKIGGNRGSFPEIVQADPEQLSFLVTAAFNLDNELKYNMLEIVSTIERLQKLREILKQAVGKMEESAEIHKVAQTNGHSNKKIGL